MPPLPEAVWGAAGTKIAKTTAKAILVPPNGNLNLACLDMTAILSDSERIRVAPNEEPGGGQDRHNQNDCSALQATHGESSFFR